MGEKCPQGLLLLALDVGPFLYVMKSLQMWMFPILLATYTFLKFKLPEKPSEPQLRRKQARDKKPGVPPSCMSCRRQVDDAFEACSL